MDDILTTQLNLFLAINFAYFAAVLLLLSCQPFSLSLQQCTLPSRVESPPTNQRKDKQENQPT